MMKRDFSVIFDSQEEVGPEQVKQALLAARDRIQKGWCQDALFINKTKLTAPFEYRSWPQTFPEAFESCCLEGGLMVGVRHVVREAKGEEEDMFNLFQVAQEIVTDYLMCYEDYDSWGDMSMAEYNDHPDRTQEEVIEVIDRLLASKPFEEE